MKQIQDLDPRRDFPRWLRTVRTRSRLSQTRLGEQIGAFGGEISWWESAKSMPSDEQLRRLFEFFEVDLGDDDAEHAAASSEVRAALTPSAPPEAPAPSSRARSKKSKKTTATLPFEALAEDEADDAEAAALAEDDSEDDSEDEADDHDAAAAAARRGPVPPRAAHPLALPMPSREELEALYLDAKLSIKLIGEHYGVSTRTARKWLRKSGVTLRTLSEQMRHSARRNDDSASTSSISSPRVMASSTPAEPVEPPDLSQSVRVRKRDAMRPTRRVGTEFQIDDETGRVVRVAASQPELKMVRPPREPEPDDKNRVRVLDLSQDLSRSAAAGIGGTNAAVGASSRMRLVAPPPRSGSRPRAVAPQPGLETAATARDAHNVVHSTTTRSSGFTPAPTALAAAAAQQPVVHTLVSVTTATNELVRLHQAEGFSVVELALRTGQSARAVREQLLAAGARIRSWREPLEIGRNETVPPAETLARQLALGVELEDLASSYDVSIARVRGWFDRHTLAPETHTRVERYTRIDGKQAALVAIADGTLVTVDPDLSFEMAAWCWRLDSLKRPITRHAGAEIPLTWFALGREPGEPPVTIEHLNGDVLDCRKANLRVG